MKYMYPEMPEYVAPQTGTPQTGSMPVSSNSEHTSLNSSYSSQEKVICSNQEFI